MTEPCRSLAGQAILITRPRPQAQALCDGVIAHGGEPWLYPVMEIEPVLHDAELLQRLATATEFDLFIFVSANDVVHGLRRGRRSQGEAWRGYPSSQKRYFHGVTIHLLVTARGQPVEFS